MWVGRTLSTAGLFAELRLNLEWPSNPDRTLSSARASYLWLPVGTPLWKGIGIYALADRVELQAVLLP